MSMLRQPDTQTAKALRWVASACGVLLVGLLVWGYIVDSRRYEERLALAKARSVAEIERVLGQPIETVRRFEDIHRSHSQDVFSPADEAAGHVLKRYVLWSEVLSFHPGYIELVVKLRPSDGAVLAAKVFRD
jgi:hypothetical protein